MPGADNTSKSPFNASNGFCSHGRLRFKQVITFPTSKPNAPDSAGMLWTIQNELLSQAERLLGARDASKKIFQPVFRAHGPHVINTPAFDGAFAALSTNAESYWPTVVYEMAHETVHLLDPIPGPTTWLEEGAAVLFSIKMSAELTTHPMAPAKSSTYSEAAALVSELPTPVFESIRRIRNAAGRLSLISPELISSLFPALSSATAHRLCEVCIPR